MSVVVALGLGLIGCSGSSDSPTTLPPISTTPAASQSTAPPQDPKAAAVAVVKQYFQAKNVACHSMDESLIAPLLTANCPCRKFLQSIRETRRAGNKYFGSSQFRAATPTVDSPTAVEVLTTYDTTRGGTKDAKGHVLFSGPARRSVSAIFDVRLVHGRWLIADIATVTGGQ